MSYGKVKRWVMDSLVGGGEEVYDSGNGLCNEIVTEKAGCD